MIRGFKEESGAALLLTILVIGLVVALSLHFSKSARMELSNSNNFSNNMELTYIAKSGLNYALAILDMDRAESEIDTLLEKWADSDALSEASASMFGSGSFQLSVQDIGGKLNINRLLDDKGNLDSVQSDLFSRFLSLEEFGLTPDEVDDIIDAIKDWMDSDDEITRFGAENSYYQSLDPPYSCRNGPLESIEELTLVKGISNELFHGNDEKPGISAFLTIYGNGRVNINTTQPLVLRALSYDIDQEAAETMDAYRMDEDNDLTHISWYHTALGTEEVIFDPDLISTKSTYFQILSKGKIESREKSLEAIVRRRDNKINILTWKYI